MLLTKNFKEYQYQVSLSFYGAFCEGFYFVIEQWWVFVVAYVILSKWDNKLLSTPKITIFLPKPLSKLHEPALSYDIPYSL